MPRLEGKVTPRGRTADMNVGIRWTKKHYTPLVKNAKIGPLGKKRRRR